MLKKKNIAMMMAVATVATTVAPAFAATVETQVVSDEAKLIADVQKMLDTKYTNSKESGKDGVIAKEAYQNSVYEITSTNAAGTVTVIKNVSVLKNLIETNKVTSTPVQLTVVDKGHRDDNGAIVATETNEYVKYTKAELSSTLTGAAELVTAGIITATPVYNSATTSTTITLANTNLTADEKAIVLTEDTYKLDLTKPVDKDGNVLEVLGSTATESEKLAIANKVVGFKTLETGLVVENGIPAKVVSELEFRNDGVTIMNNEIATFIAGGIYTEAGAELVNTLMDANAATTIADKTEVVKDGKKYTIECDANGNSGRTVADLSNVEAVKDGGYKLTINLNVTEVKATRTSNLPTDRNVQIVITSKVQKELADLRAAMTIATNSTGSNKVEAGKGAYTTLAGDDRFETAVEISKASYVKHDKSSTDMIAGDVKASAVVLVGEDAVVDGLAAAPLAKQKNAPILLTKKDAVGDSTLAEIKRVVDKNSTIYLVGGETVISKEVEAQLVKEMNAQIVRLAGDDRFETSLEIANHMVKTSTTAMTDAFVVGGDGEADAMSIASVASRETIATKVAPIIVTPAAGLTKDAKHFFEMNEASIARIGVIGGESKISTQVLKDLNDIDKTTNGVQSIVRTAGDDRHETNTAVINKYFATTGVRDVYVAKDGYVGGNGKLIDALSVAPLAGRNNAPIVLATEDLTTKQANTIDRLSKTGTAAAGNDLTKVGNGISSTVMSKLVKLLGL